MYMIIKLFLIPYVVPMVIQILQDLVNDPENTITPTSIQELNENKKTITRALLSSKVTVEKLNVKK